MTIVLLVITQKNIICRIIRWVILQQIWYYLQHNAYIDEIEFIIFSRGNIESTSSDSDLVSVVYPEFVLPTFPCVLLTWELHK